jgi:hypothetical protein
MASHNYRGIIRWTAALLLWCSGTPVPAQSWDAGATLVEKISGKSHEKLTLGFESRVRYENRTGTGFGSAPDLRTGLARTRLSLTYHPASWIKVQTLVEDSRAPWYGANAPASTRDPVDLREAYVEVGRKTGLGIVAGRAALTYGDGRLIGSPRWGNVLRTYDQARLSYTLPRARFEILLVSPVKVRLNGFNRPVMGERIWGAYNSFPGAGGKALLDVYFLRHEQNRPGGFAAGRQTAGTDRLGINTLGFRRAAPLAAGVMYGVEAAAQNGRVGGAGHRAMAWFSGISRSWTAGGKPLDASVEYKFASGSRNPGDAAASRTFDQLFPSNHDKFGHEDLFGWRNIHNIRMLATYSAAKNLAFTLMYDDSWLASARDALYNSSGKAIARSLTGSDGRHVGREADLLATYKYGHFQFGAGYGYLFPGVFVKRTTPGAPQSFAYLFHTYTL